jgi:hypothetical protein
MCWNAEVSFQSFLIGIGAIGLAYQKGLSFPTTLFSLTIVLMQLIEGVVWSYYDNKTVNFIASFLASLLLWLQPVASILTLQSKLAQDFLYLYLGLSLAGTLFSLNTANMSETYSMKRGANGHLVWNWLKKDTKTAISLFVYFLFLFGPLAISKEWTVLLLSLTTLAFSLYSYWNENTWGSMWCWIVNYIVVGICGYQIFNSQTIKWL